MTEINPGVTGRKFECETLSVPEAGRRYFGLSRNGSYAAADRGELPTVKVGRLRRVPVRSMELLLDKAGETKIER